MQRWIVAALRKPKFFSLDEVNQAIAGLLTKLNQRPFRKREGSRASLFAQPFQVTAGQPTVLSVGTVAGTPLPQSVGTIGAGASALATVTVPGSVGASGAASSLTLSGTYTGGTFSSNGRITLP